LRINSPKAFYHVSLLQDKVCSELLNFGWKKVIETTLKRFGIKAKRRKIVGSERSSVFRDPAVSYIANLNPEIGLLRSEGTYFWNDSV